MMLILQQSGKFMVLTFPAETRSDILLLLLLLLLYINSDVHVCKTQYSLQITCCFWKHRNCHTQVKGNCGDSGSKTAAHEMFPWLQTRGSDTGCSILLAESSVARLGLSPTGWVRLLPSLILLLYDSTQTWETAERRGDTRTQAGGGDCRVDICVCFRLQRLWLCYWNSIRCVSSWLTCLCPRWRFSVEHHFIILWVKESNISLRKSQSHFSLIFEIVQCWFVFTLGNQ